MAVPKKKTSKSRKNMRRAHDFAGMNNGYVQSVALVLLQLPSQNLLNADQRDGNAMFPCSGNGSLNLNHGSVIATHAVYGNSHILLSGMYMIGETALP